AAMAIPASAMPRRSAATSPKDTSPPTARKRTTARDAVLPAPRSRLLQQAILLAEAIARERVEIGAGDADHPRLLRMRGRMDYPRAIGFGLARPEAIPAHRLQNRVLFAVRIGATPFHHVGIFPRISVDRPRRPVAVRLAGLVSFLHMREHMETGFGIAVED